MIDSLAVFKNPSQHFYHPVAPDEVPCAQGTQSVVPEDAVVGRVPVPYWKNDDQTTEQVSLYPAFNSSTGNRYSGSAFKNCDIDLDHPYLIPGLGHVVSDKCGTVRHICACPEDDFVTLHFYRCHNYTCPKCYHSAANQAAERVEDRVLGLGSVFRLNGIKTGYPKHIIISPPYGEFHEGDDISFWRKKIYKIALSFGVMGGSVVFHPYRIKNEIKDELSLFVGNGDSGGYWELIHENVLGLESWRDYVIWSPHFHVVGFMPKIQIKSNKLYEESGFVYKVVKYDNKFKIPNGKIKVIVNYLLTHHAYDENKTGYTYFGILSYNKSSIIAKEKEIESIKCPLCQSNMQKWMDVKILNDGTIDYTYAIFCGNAEYVRKWSVYRVKGLPIEGSIFGKYVEKESDKSYDS